MDSNSLVKVCSSTALIMLSSAIQAGGFTNKGAYIGLGAGQTRSQVSTNNLITNPDRCNVAGANCPRDRRDKAWRIYGGYTLSKHVDVEAEYVNLGKVMQGQVQQGNVNDRYSQKTDGIGLALKGKLYPTRSQQLSLYGKAGVFGWRSKATGDFIPPVTGFGNHTSRTDKGASPTVGVGLEYQMRSNWSVRVGWDRYYKVGKRNVMLNENPSSWRTLKTNVDTYSVGLSYRF